jgi:phosphopantetheinyl transferase (holo-ACP synthase)
MIIGIGTDILNLARLHAFSPFRLNRLATRILTTNELQFLKKRLADSQIAGSDVEEGSITKFTETNGPNRDRLVAFLGVRYVNVSFSVRL